MNNPARKIIAEWRKCLNQYRAASQKLANEYIQLTSTGTDDEKLSYINIFGKIKTKQMFFLHYYIESFFPMAERDVNASLVMLDDHLSRIDNEMLNVRYSIIIISIL